MRRRGENGGIREGTGHEGAGRERARERVMEEGKGEEGGERVRGGDMGRGRREGGAERYLPLSSSISLVVVPGGSVLLV